jgi:putative FmdB family regulatory protein
MPTYAYKCKDCGHSLEVQQAFSDSALTECPVCGGRLRKQYGTVGVTFNGSGFYRTDSRSGGKSEGGKSDGGEGAAKPDGGKSDGAKPDAAPAKKEPAKSTAPAAAAGPSTS